MANRLDDGFYQQLGARVRRLREEQGWTQEEMAQAIEIEAATLSRYETARKPFPLEVLRRIAISLRLSLVTLLGETRAPTTRLADAPINDRDTEILEAWRGVPVRRRKLALRILRVMGDD